jgi:cbb3-type cytochrome oxidase subunit 3
MEQPIPIFGTPEAAASFWLLIFGIWAVSAVVNVALADVKERNHFIWGLIGLVFGPLGVLAMVLRASKKKEAAKRAAKLAAADTSAAPLASADRGKARRA